MRASVRACVSRKTGRLDAVWRDGRLHRPRVIVRHDVQARVSVARLEHTLAHQRVLESAEPEDHLPSGTQRCALQESPDGAPGLGWAGLGCGGGRGSAKSSAPARRSSATGRRGRAASLRPRSTVNRQHDPMRRTGCLLRHGIAMRARAVRRAAVLPRDLPSRCRRCRRPGRPAATCRPQTKA